MPAQKNFDQLRRLIMEDSSVGVLLWVSEDRTDPDVEEALGEGYPRRDWKNIVFFCGGCVSER
jgi:hypothetical protein